MVYVSLPLGITVSRCPMDLLLHSVVYTGSLQNKNSRLRATNNGWNFIICLEDTCPLPLICWQLQTSPFALWVLSSQIRPLWEVTTEAPVSWEAVIWGRYSMEGISITEEKLRAGFKFLPWDHGQVTDLPKFQSLQLHYEDILSSERNCSLPNFTFPSQPKAERLLLLDQRCKLGKPFSFPVFPVTCSSSWEGRWLAWLAGMEQVNTRSALLPLGRGGPAQPGRLPGATYVHVYEPRVARIHGMDFRAGPVSPPRVPFASFSTWEGAGVNRVSLHCGSGHL